MANTKFEVTILGRVALLEYDAGELCSLAHARDGVADAELLAMAEKLTGQAARTVDAMKTALGLLPPEPKED